jgi:hypothetical protein
MAISTRSAESATSDAQPPTFPPTRPRTFVGSARSMVGRLASLIHGPDAARRNAWEAVCADQERRRQWNETIEPPRERKLPRTFSGPDPCPEAPPRDEGWTEGPTGGPGQSPSSPPPGGRPSQISLHSGQTGYFSGSRLGTHTLPHNAMTGVPVTIASTSFSFGT